MFNKKLNTNFVGYWSIFEKKYNNNNDFLSNLSKFNNFDKNLYKRFFYFFLWKNNINFIFFQKDFFDFFKKNQNSILESLYFKDPIIIFLYNNWYYLHLVNSSIFYKKYLYFQLYFYEIFRFILFLKINIFLKYFYKFILKNIYNHNLNKLKTFGDLKYNRVKSSFFFKYFYLLYLNIINNRILISKKIFNLILKKILKKQNLGFFKKKKKKKKFLMSFYSEQKKLPYQFEKINFLIKIEFFNFIINRDNLVLFLDSVINLKLNNYYNKLNFKLLLKKNKIFKIVSLKYRKKFNNIKRAYWIFYILIFLFILFLFLSKMHWILYINLKHQFYINDLYNLKEIDHLVFENQFYKKRNKFYKFELWKNFVYQNFIFNELKFTWWLNNNNFNNKFFVYFYDHYIIDFIYSIYNNNKIYSNYFLKNNFSFFYHCKNLFLIIYNLIFKL